MILAAAGFGLSDLLHPLRYWGYMFWSGIGSDFGQLTLITAVLAGLVTLWHQHNCHVHNCPRLQWHVHPDHGHPVCKKHHPDHPSGGGNRITA